jgi:hypothetical protein
MYTIHESQAGLARLKGGARETRTLQTLAMNKRKQTLLKNSVDEILVK